MKITLPDDVDAAIDASFPDTKDGEAGGEKPPADDKGAAGGGDDGEAGGEKPPADDKGVAGDGEEKGKSGKIQKRFDELTREKYELRRENEELRRKLAEQTPDRPRQPDPREYKTQREYDFAMGKYTADIATWEADQAASDQQRITNEASAYQARIRTEKTRYPDFDSVVGTLAHIPMTEQLHEALTVLDNATDLLYFLGKNPRIAEDVLTRPGARQAMALSEIGTKLKLAFERRGKKVTSAPPPAAKTGAGSSGRVKKAVTEMTIDEYLEHRKKW